MQWTEITVETAYHRAEELAAHLTAWGFSDLVVEDPGEFRTFLEENRAYWDYIDEKLEKQLQGGCRVKLYLEVGDTAGKQRLSDCLDALRQRYPDIAEPKTVLLPPTDWEENWKENYPPREAGEKLLILPYWLADTDTGGRLPVIMDPGLTFGTGAHPSTRMVLANMEAFLRPGAHCLDLGSGSGILSIAALRLGAQSAVGVDIDPKAEDIARENAAYNGYAAPAFQALSGNVLTDKDLMRRLQEQTYDLVLVNIVADVILSLAPVLPDYMTEHTVLICSGILQNRLPEVRQALEAAGLRILRISEDEEWRCVCAAKECL